VISGSQKSTINNCGVESLCHDVQCFGDAGRVLVLRDERRYNNVVDICADAEKEQRHCVTRGFVGGIKQAHAAILIQQTSLPACLTHD